MPRFELDAEAGKVSTELMQRGIPAATKIHVIVEEDEFDVVPLAATAQAGGAFDWLDDEPELYSAADLLPAR